MKKIGRAWLWLGLSCLLALALRYPAADIPLERDEGEYAYIAQQWLKGEVPYTASFCQKPPGVFFIYAAIIRWAGTSPAIIHWCAQFVTLGTIGLLFFLALRLYGLGVAAAASALCALCTVDCGFLGNAANTEIFMIFFLVASLCALLKAIRDDSFVWSLATGALCAAALVVKQVALPQMLLCAVYLVWCAKRRWILLGAFAAGMAAVVAPVVLYFAASGAWSSFYECVIGYNLSYSGQVSWHYYPLLFWRAVAKTLAALWPVYAFALLGLGWCVFLCVRRPREAPPVAQPAALCQGKTLDVLHRDGLVILWALASFAGVSVGGYYREHYFIQLVPVMSFLAGIGVNAIFPKRGLCGGSCHGGLRSWGIVLALILYAVSVNAWYYRPGHVEEKCRRLYGFNPFYESIAAAQFIASHGTSDDRVLVLGSEPQILFYSARKSASRYTIVYPLMRANQDSTGRQEEFLRDAITSRPRYIVTVFAPTSFLMARRAPKVIFNTLQSMLSEGYHVAALVVFDCGKARLAWGDEARALWQKSSFWYGSHPWTNLVVWERNGTT